MRTIIPTDGIPEEIADSQSAVWRKIGEHEARLSNGRERFEEMKETYAALHAEIAQVAAKIAPRPIRWWAVIGAGLGGAVTILSLVWSLATQMTALGEGLRELGRTVEELRVEVRALR